MYLRLSTMMFLQYAVLGAVMPIMALYLKNGLGFSPAQVGVVIAMPAIAALVAPLIAARIADRLLSAERTLAAAHFLGAGLMWALSLQTAYGPVIALFLLYSLATMPTMALTNAITFHHLEQAGRDFGRIRMWGTIGWIAIAWIFAAIYVVPAAPDTAGAPDAATGTGLGLALQVSAVASLVLAFFALCIPPAHEAPAANTRLRHAVRLLLQRNLAVLCALTFIMALLNQYYMQWMAPYLSQIGFEDGAILPALSVGQLFEIGAVGLLGWFLARAGMKRLLLIGFAMQLVRFLVFALFPTAWAVIPAVSLHGISFAFFGVTAYIYLDRACSAGDRAGVQQLYSLVSAGLGALLGSVIAGYTGEWLLDGATINFRLFWLVPAAIAGAGCVILVVAFRPEPEAGG